MASRQTGNELQIDIRREPRERFGLRIFSSNVNPVTVVIGVTANGPAARCGLRIGDQLIAIDGEDVVGRSHSDIVSALADAGREIRLTVIREGLRSRNSPKTGSPRLKQRPVGLADELLTPKQRRRGHAGSAKLAGDAAQGNVVADAEEKQFASLLQVPLPAEYKCIGIARQGLPGPCALHAEPTLGSEKVGLIHPGMYVTVCEQRGTWLFADESADARSPAGWVNAGSGGREYFTPVPPENEYPWQRARGTGVYDSVLLHRKDELSQLNLADDLQLLKEWHVVIAELDVALRIRAKVDAAGMLLVHPTYRPRALSFQSKWGIFGNSNRVGAASSQARPKAARKRSNSFASWRGPTSSPALPKRVHGPLHETPGEDQGIDAVRERWRDLQRQMNKKEWDARTMQRKNVLVSEHRSGGRMKHHVLGRLARERAGEIKVRSHQGQIRKPEHWSSVKAPVSSDLEALRCAPVAFEDATSQGDAELTDGPERAPPLSVYADADEGSVLEEDDKLTAAGVVVDEASTDEASSVVHEGAPNTHETETTSPTALPTASPTGTPNEPGSAQPANDESEIT